ncbi:hypothetical protein Prum_010260 [Phytohabitans rumicis]|uniref:Secreted protein n=2 Tax=Phytohabitans rumicis TaxID=1076125 RepID=A0A6V8KU74_9ACTN|nr:hypothetical protein Prum_010260 [Phytohabitans rumicis]
MLRRVMAVVAVCIAFIGATVWATPASALERSTGHPDTLSRYCAAFRSEYTETRDSYSCDLGEDAIMCFTDDRGCLFYAAERKPGQLPSKCEEAGGRFFDEIVIFTCDKIAALPDFDLTVECTWEQLGNPKLPCVVYSEPPM